MITGTISASDYLDAQRLHRARAVHWIFVLCGVSIAVGIAVAVFYQRRLGIIFSCAGVGGLITEVILSSFFLPRNARRLHRQQRDFASPFTYSWDDEFLEGKSVSGQSKRKWRDYAKYKEDEKVFLVYHADNLFEVLPKNWFRDQAQIDEFRSFANRDAKS
jgi:YcxB-like protein